MHPLEPKTIPQRRKTKKIVPNVIGPHANQKLNQRGKNIHALMNQLKLRAITTFYQSKSYDTWLHLATKEGCLLDHFFVPIIHAKYIVDVKQKMNRVPSNQAAISLKLKLPNFKFVPLNKRTSTKNEAKKINNKLL